MACGRPDMAFADLLEAAYGQTRVDGAHRGSHSGEAPNAIATRADLSRYDRDSTWDTAVNPASSDGPGPYCDEVLYLGHSRCGPGDASGLLSFGP